MFQWSLFFSVHKSDDLVSWLTESVCKWPMVWIIVDWLYCGFVHLILFFFGMASSYKMIFSNDFREFFHRFVFRCIILPMLKHRIQRNHNMRKITAHYSGDEFEFFIRDGVFFWFALLKMASISWIILGLCLNHNIYNIGVLISLSPNDNHYVDDDREKKKKPFYFKPVSLIEIM